MATVVWRLALLGACGLGASPDLSASERIDPQRARISPDGATLWYDCKDLAVEGKGWADTKAFYDRLPARAEGKVPPSVWNLSHDSTGLCVFFATDAPSLQVHWTTTSANLAMPHMPATGVSGVDLYAKDKSGQWCFVGNGRPAAASNTALFTPPPGSPCLLYLPLYNGVTSVEIGIPKGRTLSTPDALALTQRKPVVFYGTSITQGGCASRPGMAFTAIVGRQLDVAVINLGFSGSGKMEPAMADLLAELDPSVYVLDCVWNMSPEEVSVRVEPFVKRLRLARPNTPIVLAEDSSVQNICPTEKGRLLRAIYKNLVAGGIENLHFLSNQNMLGDDGDGTVDGCHPNDLGMARQAIVFTKALTPVLQPGGRQ
jgi:hypothetical protein